MEPDEAASQPHDLEHFREEIDDALFNRLRSVFLAFGKGRRPKLPVVEVTNRLLVQLVLLKTDGQKTFDETATFLYQILPEGVSAPLQRLRHLLVTAEQQAVKLTDCDQRTAFLSQKVELGLDSFGSSLRGLSRQQLLDGQHASSHRPPTFELLRDLHTFKKREPGATYKNMSEWWLQLTGITVSDKKLKKEIEKLQKKLAKLRPNATRNPNVGKELSDFLASCAFSTDSGSVVSEHVDKSGSTADSVSSESVSYAHSCSTSIFQKLSEGAVQLATARRREEELQKELSELKLQLSTAVSTSRQHFLENQQHLMEKESLTEAAAQANASLQELQKEKVETLTALRESETKLNYYKKQGDKKKLKRRDDKIAEQEAEVEQATRLAETRTIERNEATRKLRVMQLRFADVKRRLKLTLRRFRRLKRQPEIPAPPEEAPLLLRLKDEKGHFKQEAVACVMLLVGECEIAPSRCGTVIQAVAKLLLNATVPDSDLPSTRSAIRFADIGHVLSKMQVSEALLHADAWDLHVDGTSRSGKKYTGHQVNVDGQVLSAGFAPACVENTTTLVEMSFNLLQEVSEVMDHDKVQENFVAMLSSMCSTMTDRASVMKSFGRQLDVERREILQMDSPLQILHCNAHLLLGISSACEKVLKQEEKASGEKLGRDKLPAFSSFKSAVEGSAARYVRLASDCLGPRGDDKSSCRDSWETYCEMVGIKSRMTSYRANRFNNLFQAAAALHFHRAEIEQFLQLYLVKQNRKIQSIFADNMCDEIDCHITALGLLYFRVTGPYWALLAQDIHYLDFYIYVDKLLNHFQRWAADPADAFNQDVSPIFDEPFMPDPDVFQALLSISDDRQAKVKATLKNISTGIITTINNQLKDFLEGGRYYNVQDPELRQQMEHCKLTNLIGEQAFGDLDFSLFKRRNASLHHHSSVNMMKRNKPISVWYSSKNEEEKTRLLDLSAKKAPALRKQHVREEKDCVTRRRIILDQNRQTKENAQAKRRDKINSIVTQLRLHRGPCYTAADVNHLLFAYAKRKDQIAALKAEVQYHKLVLGKKSPLLRVGGSVQQLTARLKAFLTENPAVNPCPAPILPASGRANPPPTGRANLPATRRANLPATRRANPPPTGRANLPATRRANLPATGRANLPATRRANLPATRRANLPPTGRANPPPTGRANLPATRRVSQQLVVPISLRLVVPTPLQLVVPTPFQLVVPTPPNQLVLLILPTSPQLVVSTPLQLVLLILQTPLRPLKNDACMKRHGQQKSECVRLPHLLVQARLPCSRSTTLPSWENLLVCITTPTSTLGKLLR